MKKKIRVSQAALERLTKDYMSLKETYNQRLNSLPAGDYWGLSWRNDCIVQVRGKKRIATRYALLLGRIEQLSKEITTLFRVEQQQQAGIYEAGWHLTKWGDKVEIEIS